MKRFLTLLSAAALLSLGSESHAKTLALLTGVGNYGDPRNNLDCLDADIANIKKLVQGPLGVADQDLLLVTEQKATAANILQSFRDHLIKKAGPGDTVFFYYSGHGYHVPDHNGDEEDGQDEILAPFGVNILQENSYITDDQIGALIRELRCSRAIIVLDSCHSGTGTRGLNDRITKTWKPPYDLPSEAETAKATSSFDYKPRPRNDSFGRLPAAAPSPKLETLVFMACRPEETALGPKSGSLFTARLVKEMTSRPGEEIGTLMKSVSEAVATQASTVARGHKQQPQFEGPASARLVAAAAVASSSVQTPPATAPTPATTTPAVRPQSTASTTPPGATVPAASTPVPGSASSVISGEIIQHRDFAVLMQLVDAKTGKNLAGQKISVGTEVQVQVQPAENCYVRLYHRDAAGHLTLVFPNIFQKNDYVRAESKAQFPTSNDTFRFVIEEPLGIEIIKAVCSSVPFKDEVLPPEQGRPFYRLPGLHTGELSTRGLGAYATRPVTATSAAAAPAERHQAESYVNYLVVR